MTDQSSDLPAQSEVDAQLPEGHVAAREQTGEPQSLQGLSDTLGNQYPVVISTGRTDSDERQMEADLLAAGPVESVPAQDPTPPQEGDELPVDPQTGQLSLQGGPSQTVTTPQGAVAATGTATVSEGGTTDSATTDSATTDSATTTEGGTTQGAAPEIRPRRPK